MKLFFIIILIGAAILFIISCKKESNDSNNYTVTSYTTTDSMDTFLFINNESKGQLPFIASGADDCNDSKALNLSLAPGSYNLSLKDGSGNLKNSWVLVISEDASITGSNYSLVQIGKCLLLGLDY